MMNSISVSTDPPSVYLKIVSCGEWKSVVWCYVGETSYRGMLMPIDFDFKNLQRKLIHKLDIVDENLQITYLYHTESEARRVSITNDDDLDAFKFLNNKSNKSEWDIELYITSAPKSPIVVSSNHCYLGPPILAPTTFTVVEVNYRRSTKMLIRRLSEYEAEVRVGADSFSVDLKERTCTCRKFQVDQVPCVHAIAFADDRKVELHNLVHPMYTNAMVSEVYKETVRSVPPKSKWSVPPNVAMKKLSPPGVTRVVGRPRVNWLKAFWERSYYNRKCSYYGRVGHTTTYCWKRKSDGA